MRSLFSLDDFRHVGRGLLMGGADIVPGVSGGTVALILGIYRRLVTALSHFDGRFLAELAARNWLAAARHIDLRFLMAVGLGVGIGVASLARLMHYLLEVHPEPTWSLFFGLILASSVLVARLIRQWNGVRAILAIVGAAFAYWLMGQLPAVPPTGAWYLFLCGVVGSCAMILPGISGAFIVLIMGKYLVVTGAVKDMARLHVTSEALMVVAVFGAGWVVGILGLSKVLRRLFERHEAATLAVLCGFMFGSLRKIWPFKRPATVDDFPGPLAAYGLDPEKLERITFNQWPATYDSHFWMCVFLACVGLVTVMALDYWTGGAANDASPTSESGSET